MSSRKQVKIQASTAVVYGRVSSREQAEHGVSLDAQVAAGVAEATRRGLEYVVLTDAGFSGKTIKRPAFEQALAMLASGEAQVLIAQRLDRISRSMVDFVRLVEHSQEQEWSVTVLDVNLDFSTPVGMLISTILAAFAAFERDTLIARTREGMAEAKAQGRRVGRPAALPDATVRRIVRLAGQGKGLSEIARLLTEQKVPTAHGGQWHPSTVRSIIARSA
jgi:DNA invertase Pin-like site-specific DNA recombinase